MCVIWNRQGKLGKIILFTYQQGYRHRDTGGYQEFFRLTFSHCSECQSTHCIINWPRSSLKAGCHSSWRVNLKMPWKHQQLPGNLCTCVCVCAHSVVSNSSRRHGLAPTRLLCPWSFPGKDIRVSCHFLLQGMFLIQGLNPRLFYLLHWYADSLPLSHLGSPTCVHI